MYSYSRMPGYTPATAYPIRDEKGFVIAWARTKLAAELIISCLNSNEMENK